MVLKSFVPSRLEAVGFLRSYMLRFEGKYVDLFIIKSIMEEDNFHDPGFAVNKHFAILFFKDIGSIL